MGAVESISHRARGKPFSELKYERGCKREFLVQPCSSKKAVGSDVIKKFADIF